LASVCTKESSWSTSSTSLAGASDEEDREELLEEVGEEDEGLEEVGEGSGLRMASSNAEAFNSVSASSAWGSLGTTKSGGNTGEITVR